MPPERIEFIVLRTPTSWLGPVYTAAALFLLCLLTFGLEVSVASEPGGQRPEDSAATATSARPVPGATDRPPFAAAPVDAYQPHYLVGNNLSEIWDYRLWFPNGYLLNCRFMITSFGPGERTGLVLSYVLPPEGDMVVIKNSRKWGDWKDLTDRAGPQFAIAKNRLNIDLPSHHLHVENEKGTLDLHLRSTVDPLRTERILLSQRQWYDVTFYAPRLEASGDLLLPGQAPLQLENGRGIATHIVSNVPDNRQSVSLFRFDSFDAPTQMSLYQLTLQASHAYRKVGFLTTFQNNQIVIHSTTFDRVFSNLKPDPNYKAYLVPKGFSVDYDSKSETFEGEATLQFHRKRPQEILDLVNSRLLRFFLKKVAPNPVLYQNRSDYRFDINHSGHRALGKESHGPVHEAIEVVTGQGFASLYLTMKPPHDF